MAADSSFSLPTPSLVPDLCRAPNGEDHVRSQEVPMTKSILVSASLISLASLSAFACAPRNATGPGAAHADNGDATEKVKRMRAWEAPALKRFHMELPQGIMTADVEAAAPPKVACKDSEGGLRTCGITLEFGTDEDGTAHTLECSASWAPVPLPFGMLAQTTLGDLRLEEIPRFEVAWSQGPQPALVANFTAQAQYETDQNVIVGTAKFAARYVPGHTLFCSDTTSGGEKTVARVVKGLFESVQIKDVAKGVLLQSATRERKGDTPTGFRFEFVRKNDDGSFAEVKSSFRLITNEKHWDVRDFTMAIARDDKGAVESLRQMYWDDKKVAGILSAKPAEGGKLRLKLEREGKSDALELTPQAPLSTELWESPGLLRVSSGAAAGHKYAILSVADDGEPALAYAKLARLRGNVVQEEIERPGTRGKNASHEKNELTVDERGFVIKQVSKDSVDERLHHSGTLPGRTPDAPRANTSKAKKS